MRITMVAATRLQYEPAMESALDQTGKEWHPQFKDATRLDPDSSDGSLLIEFAGRACYESFNAPNPATRLNEDYIQHLIEVGHTSVLEHATVTFYVTDVSRSLTHELIRHRHLSYSQQSQRFVKMDIQESDYVGPPLFNQHQPAHRILRTVWETSVDAYERLVGMADAELAGMEDRTMARKMAREAARAVLPNMTPTAIVVTGNHTAWRHFLDMRGSIHADAEIRALACGMYRELNRWEPAVYADYGITKVDLDEVHATEVLERVGR